MFVSGGLRSLTDLLKMNVILRKHVFCAISTSKVYGPYFFPDRTVNGETFRNMLRSLCHNWNMTVLTLSISWMEPHATITLMLGPSVTRHCLIDGLEEQSPMINIYSGHRGHRTWHPVIFSYGDTLKTMPTNHHSPKMCENCKIAFELWCKPLMGTCWSAFGRRLSYWHLQSNEGRSHWAFVSWFLWVNKLGYLHYLCVKLYLILTINK